MCCTPSFYWSSSFSTFIFCLFSPYCLANIIKFEYRKTAKLFSKLIFIILEAQSEWVQRDLQRDLMLADDVNGQSSGRLKPTGCCGDHLLIDASKVIFFSNFIELRPPTHSSLLHLYYPFLLFVCVWEGVVILSFKTKMQC